MNFRTTLIVGILVAILGSYAYFYEYKGGEKRKEQEEQVKALVEVKKEDVAALKLENNGQVVELRPAGKDVWEITSPLKARADDSAVGRILSSLEKVKYKEIIEEKPADLAQYELDHPKTVVRITPKNGPEKVLRIGARNPVLGLRYLSVNNDPRVYTLEGDLAESATVSLLDLRDKKLTDFSSDKVQSMSIHTPSLDLVFAREAGIWKMQKPVAAPASDSEVNGLLSTLEFLRATSFEDAAPEPKAFGLDAPSASVELVLDKGMRQKILFGRVEGSDVFLQVEGSSSIAKVADAFSAIFAKPLDDWREKKMLVFNRFDVEELRIKSEGKEYVFKKGAEDKWTQESPAKKTPAEDKLQNMMEKIELAEIEAYGDAAALPGPSAFEITMSLKDWQNAITKKHLAFGAVEGNRQSVKNDDYNTIVYVNGAVQAGVVKDLAELQK